MTKPFPNIEFERAAQLLDRLMHHRHLLKFEGKSWRLKEAAARIAKRDSTE